MTTADVTWRGDSLARRAGDWLVCHQGAVRRLQWLVVAVYLVLVAVPAFLPLPDRSAHIWNSITLFAQFVFWGIWWPFVLLSMVLVGRSWCGLICPEGTLTEFASRYGQGRALPRWLTWGGWPFVTFACVTIYGQMVSVYQYPKPVLVVLGGSTVAAILVGLRYGRNKRVWCRYLCPVNGVFALLTKLSPLHFRVDPEAWQISQRRREHPERVNCAPLVPIRTMRGASDCHMCGRCSGFRGAVALSTRAPNEEIVNVAGRRTNPWETVLIVFGLMGIGLGAFHWSASPWFVSTKQALAEWLVEHGVMWPLELTAPWWILTNYPTQNDVMTLLDGAVLIGYILATGLIVGGAVTLLLAGATRVLGAWSWRRFHHLAQSLLPLAACGVFLGLSALSVTVLRAEGLTLSWVGAARGLLLAGAALWSVWLAWRVAGLTARGLRRGIATACVTLATVVGLSGWGLLFWVW
ncbi:MAG: 4Fe-4S binding protein [Hyphomicrobiales bacterium]|nr:4Fe-4S binding protein [Hyphomicrobiales bacterium]MBV8826044.1 4Fe-4S binding protein [Hyphomicrobiales bacterium]